jgi:GntR family transcriptional repressor for pyruvate dehydrogenase complex
MAANPDTPPGRLCEDRICMTTSFSPVAAGDRLSVQVAQQLAAEIAAGRLAPGDRLPTEAQLVGQFRVSRTVVREALSRLKSLGLVESRQGSGVYVHPQAACAPLRFDVGHGASRDAVLQMVEVRRALEAEAADLAARRRTPAQVDDLRQTLAALDAAVAAGRDGVEEDVRFHRAIAEATANPFLMGTLDYLARFQRGSTQVTRANEARRDDFAAAVRAEHHAILAAIEAGDPDAARDAAREHMHNAAARIRQADPAFWQQEGTRLAEALVAAPDLPRAG